MSEYVSVRLVGAGSTLEIDGAGQGAFVHVLGSTGFGMVPTTTRYMAGSGTGSTFLGKRLNARAGLLKLGVLGDTRQELEDNWNTLAVVLRDDDLIMQVVYPDESVFQLGINYESGLEGSFASSDLRHTPRGWLATADVAFTAPDPFWRRADATTFSLENGSEAPGFLTHLARLRLGLSHAISDTLITNPGTVPAQVRWRFRGPADAGTTVSINGQGFEITRALSASDTVVVDASQVGLPAVTLNGVRSYSILAKAPKFPVLQPGVNAVGMSMPGAVAPTWTVSDLVEAVNESTNPAMTGSLGALTGDGVGFVSDGEAGFTSSTDLSTGCWLEFTDWSQPWVSARFECAGDNAHLFVEFWAGDVLAQSVFADPQDGWAAVGGVPVPDGTTRIRVGVGFYGQSGTVGRNQVVFQQTSYAWFDGDSDGCTWEHETSYRWTGTANASTSQELVDGVVTRTNLATAPQIDDSWTTSAAGSTFTRNVEADGGPDSISWTRITFSKPPTSSPLAIISPKFSIPQNWALTASIRVASSWTGFAAVRLDVHLLDSQGKDTTDDTAQPVLSAPGVWEVRQKEIHTGQNVQAWFGVSFSGPQQMPVGTWIGAAGLLLETGTTVGDFFSGDTTAVGSGRSLKHVLTKQGGSLVEGSFHAGKEVVV